MSFGHPRVLVFRLQKPLPVDVLSWGIQDWGRELIALGAEHGLALEVAYGDWQGFVDGVRALKRSHQKHPFEIEQASLN